MLRRGFKTKANSIARHERHQLGLAAHAPLDPRRVADRHGIIVHPLSSFASTNGRSVTQLLERDPSAFSACTIRHGDRRLIVINDAHQVPRQAADVAHELAHELLGHPQRPAFDNRGCRHLDPAAEEEANWLGPALLVSDEAALHIVRRGLLLADAAIAYGVSEQVMRFRLNVTGAYKRVA
jgi:Zn-dependent peptidase ImmA (M78 family)